MDEITKSFAVSQEQLRKWIQQHQIGNVSVLGVASGERGTLPAHARQNPRLDSDERILVVLSQTVFGRVVVCLARRMIYLSRSADTHISRSGDHVFRQSSDCNGFTVSVILIESTAGLLPRSRSAHVPGAESFSCSGLAWCGVA